MRALTLTQPWATAVARGLKHWETRSWCTGFRGTVAIHAAKRFPKFEQEFAKEKGIFSAPISEIVCICDLTACYPTRSMGYFIDPDSEEWGWGDYSEGRYAFKLDNVFRLLPGVTAKGSLGFWTVNTELEKQIMSAVEAR